MRQLYPDPDDMARAQDSIQRQLDTFEEKLWVPSLEDLEAQREALEAMEAEGDSTAVAGDQPKPRTRASGPRGSKKETKPAVKSKRGKSKGPKTKEAKTTTAPRRSVRDRKR